MAEYLGGKSSAKLLKLLKLIQDEFAVRHAQAVEKNERQEWIMSHHPIGWIDSLTDKVATYEEYRGYLDTEMAYHLGPGFSSGPKWETIEVEPSLGDYGRFHYDGLVKWNGKEWVVVEKPPQS